MIQSCVEKSIITAREIAWSRKDQDKPLFISSVVKGESSTEITYRYIGLENKFTIPFIDDASIEDALHGLAVCIYLMVPPKKISKRMAALEPLAMRLEVKDGKQGCIVINDSYNSDISSLGIALDLWHGVRMTSHAGARSFFRTYSSRAGQSMSCTGGWHSWLRAVA